MGFILLTSCGFITKEIKEVFVRSFKDDYKHFHVAIITTASSQKENNFFAQKAKKDFQEFGFKHIYFVDIAIDIEPLKTSDIIYLNSGNPFTLLYYLNESKAKEIIATKKYLIGESAGAIVLGKTLPIIMEFTPEMNNKHLTNLTALNIINYDIFPHYDRPDLFPNISSIEEKIKKYEEKYNGSIYRLNDFDFIIENI